MKLFYLFIALFFLQFGNVFSQNIIIKYYYLPTGYWKDSSGFDLREPNRFIIEERGQEFKPIDTSFSHEGKYSITEMGFNINDTVLLLIGEGFGHVLMILPENDTLSIYADSILTTFPFFGKDSLLIAWHIFYRYKSKNEKIYQFYDSLEMNTGSPLYHRINYELAKTGYDNFFSLCTQLYNRRIKFTDKYFSRYNLPDDIKSLFVQEIKSGYILNLLQVFQYNPPKLPYQSWLSKEFIDTLNSFEYNNPRYLKKTTMYAKAIATFSYYYIFYSPISKQPGLLNEYDTTKNRFSSIVRDFMLQSFFDYNAKSKEKIYDSLLLDFKNITLDTIAYKKLESSRKAFLIAKKISLKSVLLTKIFDSKNNQTTIQLLLANGKPVFIDNWASWCLPCLAQMKYSSKLEKKYGSKINFVYLSLDKNESQWRTKSKELNLFNSYIVENSFESIYSNYFQITSIPRYIIIDKTGKVITTNAPFPSDGKLLEGLLEKFLKK